jgi:hypothetical protein
LEKVLSYSPQRSYSNNWVIRRKAREVICLLGLEAVINRKERAQRMRINKRRRKKKTNIRKKLKKIKLKI